MTAGSSWSSSIRANARNAVDIEGERVPSGCVPSSPMVQLAGRSAQGVLLFADEDVGSQEDTVPPSQEYYNCEKADWQPPFWDQFVLPSPGDIEGTTAWRCCYFKIDATDRNKRFQGGAGGIHCATSALCWKCNHEQVRVVAHKKSRKWQLRQLW